jgi:hypothetical protein
VGYSGRFGGLLRSGALVVKSTIYDEFYRDWIQPWYHHIPLSLTFDEAYDIYAYFFGLPDSLDDKSSRKEAAKKREGPAAERFAMAGKIALNGQELAQLAFTKPAMRSYSHR